LLDTVRAYAKINETAQKSKKGSFQADASFIPKWTTAWIVTAWQKHSKMSTARIIKNWKSGTFTAVRLKNYIKNWKSGTYTAVWLKNRVG
jgi:hypothetical protein